MCRSGSKYLGWLDLNWKLLEGMDCLDSLQTGYSVPSGPDWENVDFGSFG